MSAVQPGFDVSGVAKDESATETCSTWIPQDMQVGAAGPLEVRRQVYTERRRVQRRAFRRFLMLVVVVFVAGIAVVGSTPVGSVVSNVGGNMVFWSPLALLVVWAFYAKRRRDERIEGLEDATEAGPEARDPFPADRLIPGASTRLVSFVTISGALILGMIPWISVWTRAEPVLTADLVLAALGTALICSVVLISVRLLRRAKVIGTPDGLTLVSATYKRQVPWSDVRGIRIGLTVVQGRYGQSETFPIVVETVDGAWHHGLFFAYATRGDRERARHNIRVMDRWTTEHGLTRDPTVTAALAFAAGACSAADVTALATDADASGIVL